MTTKPVSKFSIGRVQTSIWKNEGKDDSVFFTAKVEHFYNAGEEWKPTNSYNARELVHLAKSALKAHSIIGELTHGQNEEDQEEQEDLGCGLNHEVRTYASLLTCVRRASARKDASGRWPDAQGLKTTPVPPKNGEGQPRPLPERPHHAAVTREQSFPASLPSLCANHGAANCRETLCAYSNSMPPSKWSSAAKAAPLSRPPLTARANLSKTREPGSRMTTPASTASR